MMLSDVCLSRTSGLSREPRGLGRQKLTQSHVTRIPLSRLKDQRSRSPGRFTHRSVNASGSCSGERGNVLAVGTYVLRCCLHSAGAVGSATLQRPQREERGGGILWRPCKSALADLISIISIIGFGGRQSRYSGDFGDWERSLAFCTLG